MSGFLVLENITPRQHLMIHGWKFQTGQVRSIYIALYFRSLPPLIGSILATLGI